jgi:L-seryl-tRNA(Ser) seleniumtransferase
MKSKELAHIPSMDVLLNDTRIMELIERYSRGEIKLELQRVVDEIRGDIRSGLISKEPEIGERIIKRVETRFSSGKTSTLMPVINATGVILHTNLGRSLLPRQAIDAIDSISRGYCTLEYDLDKGERGSRHIHCEDLIRRITGAESAMVVNNNAAAVTLILNTFSTNKEAVVSRGELVEIGGSFRMPDIMSKSGARMVEVGTTNKTKLSDYRNALSKNTGILVKVHKSNFKMSGFVDEVSIGELAELSRETSVPLLYDQGSGVILDLEKYGVAGEETVGECLKEGASIVCFSGDKMLGGPQAGIITGSRKHLDTIKSNPLTRTYRVDKFTLAALEATLKLYLEPERAIREIPVLRMLAATCTEIRKRGESIIGSLGVNSRSMVTMLEVSSEVGGGSLPATTLPSIALVLTGGDRGINELESAAREWNPPIIGRIYHDRFHLDLRTVLEDDDGEIIAFLKVIL